VQKREGGPKNRRHKKTTTNHVLGEGDGKNGLAKGSWLRNYGYGNQKGIGRSLRRGGSFLDASSEKGGGQLGKEIPRGKVLATPTDAE